MSNDTNLIYKDNLKERRKKNISKTILMIVLVFIALLQLFPLVWAFSYSIKTSGDLFGPELLSFPKNPQWVNYKTAFVDGKILKYLSNTLSIIIPSVIFGTILPFSLAYATTRMEWKLKPLVWTVVIAGLTVPIHTTLLPNFIWFNKIGLLDSHLGLIICYIAFSMSFNSIIFSGLLSGIPKSMEESAFLEGAPYRVILPSIIAPMAVTGFSTVAIQTFLNHWNEFIMANTYLSTESKRTLPFSLILFDGQYSSNYAVQFACMVLVALPPLILYFAFSSKIMTGVTAGAVKG
ncbi:MAG: carbohydrate ABC transporter permease [Sphaerochaetaceae bacterium]|nr:carbohydrate ABC transporter permease [Sphaerochaetaceae bacterium]MDC7250002.1 carbohydrate ABC transporter permease [Sphaerochaetaceae bacterium]